MAEQTKTIEDLIHSLPADLQQEVFDFARFLAETRMSRPKYVFKFDWEGGLSDLRDRYTSVELQHDILKQRDDNVSS